MMILNGTLPSTSARPTSACSARWRHTVLREPSIVAVDKYTGRMLKVGQDAQKMLGRTPANIVAIHPISAGVIRTMT